jgi:16S rRNA (cytosine967-C5)-methyltransferase
MTSSLPLSNQPTKTPSAVQSSVATEESRVVLSLRHVKPICQLIDRLLQFDRASDKIMSGFFKDNRQLGGYDRHVIAELGTHLLRHCRWLSWLAEMPVDEESGLAVKWHRRSLEHLALVTYLDYHQGSLLQLDPLKHANNNPHTDKQAWQIPEGDAKLQLDWSRLKTAARLIQRRDVALAALIAQEDVPASKKDDVPLPDLAVQLSIPDWLWDTLVMQYDEVLTIQLLQALNQSAPLDIRVNPIKSNMKAMHQVLRAVGVAAEPITLNMTGVAGQPDDAILHTLEYGFRLAGKPAINRQPAFEDGWFEVQDAGSQWLVQLVAPKRGEMVADFCAGAGGKTLALGAMMRSTGRLYAFDVAERRLAKLKPRLARSGLSNVHPQLIDSENDSKLKRLAQKFDKVLVDAPCSGLGTIRRNPDLKWKHQPQALSELHDKQLSILRAAAKLIKVGGKLVYATCSILADENQRVLADFLADHPMFQVDEAAPQGYALLPHQQACDGFYAAVLYRQEVRQAPPAAASDVSALSDASETPDSPASVSSES